MVRSGQPRTSPRGFTLVEMMLYAALMSILGTVLAATFVLSHRYFLVAQRFGGLLSDVQRGVIGITAEIADASPTTVQEPSSSELILLSPRGADGRISRDASTGRIVWQKWVYYYQSGNQLLRAEYRVPSLPSVTPPAFPSTSSFTSNRAVVERPSGMLTFSVVGTNPICVSLTLCDSVLGLNDNQVTLSDQVHPRN